jgi:hypothetical protein
MQFLKSKFSEKVAMPGIFPDENTNISEDVYTENPLNELIRFILIRRKLDSSNLKLGSVLSASAAAKQLGIYVCTAQRWAKQYEQDPNSIFEKDKKTGL